MTGTILSQRYQLLELIGSGGMAQVYRALDMLEGREVAVKILRKEYNDDAEFVRRFEREAKAAYSMNHKNIVQMSSLGREGDIRYIVMEYIRGVTLKDIIIKRGRLQPEEAIAIAVQIARALEHAHQNHIVHRDIKPQNIMVDHAGNVKVTDFGIARATNSATVTLADGSVMGSVYYFSPEQARGGLVEEKSDIYSLGVVLYEMVTGVLPFDGDSPVTIAMMHIREPAKRPRRFDASIPLALESIILKAMEKDKEYRYDSAHEMELDLLRALKEPQGNFVKRAERSEFSQPRLPVIQEHEAMLEPSTGKRSSKYLWVLVATLSVVVLAMLSVFVIYPQVRQAMRVEVPNFLGSTEARARVLAEQSELELHVLYENGDDDTVGLVVKQSAIKTKVDPGSTITVTINSGLRSVVVPKVIDQSVEEARRTLGKEGLSNTPFEVTKEMSDKPVGTVIRQIPEPGEDTKSGSSVHLWISDGAVSLPSVIGEKAEAARDALRLLNLEVRIVLQDDASAPDTVFRQEPAGGDNVQVMQSTTVTLYVSNRIATSAASFSVEVTTEKADTAVQLRAVYPDQTEAIVYSKVFEAGVHTIEERIEYHAAGTGELQVYVGDVLVNTIPLEFVQGVTGP